MHYLVENMHWFGWYSVDKDYHFSYYYYNYYYYFSLIPFRSLFMFKNQNILKKSLSSESKAEWVSADSRSLFNRDTVRVARGFLVLKSFDEWLILLGL